MRKTILVFLISYVLAKSAETVITTAVGSQMTFWTTIEGSSYPGQLTLNCKIDISDQELVYRSGGEMRIGVEIAIPDKKYTFRE